MLPDEPISGPLKVAIVADNASARFGGEAVLPLHYFRLLRRRGVDACLIVHARTRDELAALLPQEMDRIHFVPDTAFHKLAFRAGRFLPARLSAVTLGYLSRLYSQRIARDHVRRLIREEGVGLVHQPTPVSPKEPSLLHGLGVPVVIGPMNGGMDYPPAFARLDGRLASLGVAAGRKASALLHLLMPGKIRAAVLLVANERTRRALPSGVLGEVVPLVENGVDLDVWSPTETSNRDRSTTRFAFIGRLVDWKCVDILLEAFSKVWKQHPATLEILGDGPMRPALEAQAEALGLRDAVAFSGWQPQAECARRLREADSLVLPSVYECGGAVVLEAMACGLPVVATNWGGPADYLDPSCGILVEPGPRDAFVAGLADAMIRLAASPDLRDRLGRAGRAKVVREFDWERKVDRILEVYRRAVAPAAAPANAPPLATLEPTPAGRPA